MGYSLLTIRKLKSDQDFVSAESELYGTADERFLKKYRESIDRFSYYKKARRKLPGSGFVRAILISCAYIDEPAIDFDSWIETCKSWMSTKFIISDHTLLAWVPKQDDKNGYLYAVIIPLTPEERICYNYYFQHKNDFIEYIKLYAKTMETIFKLKQMTPRITAALSKRENPVLKIRSLDLIPEPVSGESADQYYSRIRDLLIEQFIATSNESGQKLKALEKENEKLLRELLPLHELTKKYGNPDKWKQMMHTALKVKYAVRASQSQGDQETVDEIKKILKLGEDYILKHGIKF